MKENLIDVNKINSLNKQAKYYLRKKPKESIEYAKQALSISYDIENSPLIAESLINLGFAYWVIGEMDKAYTNIDKALGISEETNNENMQLTCLKIMGNIQLELAKYEEAMSCYLKALKLNESLNNRPIQADLYNNIGEIHREHGQYEKAIPFYLKSLEIDLSLPKRLNRGITFDNLSAAYLKIGDFKRAKEYNRSCLDFAKEEGQDLVYLYGRITQAEIFEEEGNEEKALEVLEEARNECKRLEESFFLQRILVKMMELFYKAKRYKDVFKYYEYFTECNETQKLIYRKKALHFCAKAHEVVGDMQASIKSYKEYYKLSEEGYKKQKELEKTIVKVKYQNIKDKQEKELYELKNIKLKEKIEALEIQSKAIESAYRRMQLISEIGRMMTSTLDLERILEIMYTKLSELMEINTIAVGLIEKEQKVLSYKLYIEDGIKMPMVDTDLEEVNFSTWVIKNKEISWIKDLEKAHKKYLEIDLSVQSKVGEINHSAFFCPLILREEVIGVLTIQNKEKDAFDEEDYYLVKSISTYLAIAIYNAERSLKLKNEISEKKSVERQLKEINYRLRDLSVLDELTGAYNRRYFQEKMEELWNRALRDKSLLAVVIVDIDRFKEYNDTYGHLEGDRCLKKVVRILNSNVKRESDFIARFGGDEFIIVLPYTNENGLKKLLKNIYEDMKNIKMKHETSDIKPYVTLSMGAAYGYANINGRYEHLVATADKALYMVKEDERDGYHSISMDWGIENGIK